MQRLMGRSHAAVRRDFDEVGEHFILGKGKYRLNEKRNICCNLILKQSKLFYTIITKQFTAKHLQPNSFYRELLFQNFVFILVFLFKRQSN